MSNETAHGMLTEQMTVPGYPQPQPDTRKALTWGNTTNHHSHISSNRA